jgi:uncharacterized protein (TIGR02594 family)
MNPMDQAFRIAGQNIGMNERDQNAALSEFMRNGGVNLDPAVTAWCAAYVNASLEQAGIEGTGRLNARSFMDWGVGVDEPQRGDLAVFSRGDPSGWQGHVGFFDGYGDDGRIRVLGGNQGDAVSRAYYDPGRLLGFRRADGGEGVSNALAGQPTAPQGTNALSGPQDADVMRQRNALAMLDRAQARPLDVFQAEAPVATAPQVQFSPFQAQAEYRPRSVRRA